ncbi:MAG: 3-hydroxyacyl-ACP dehydratase FabZ [Clostridiales bacterium]|nr:3-hydroxyacyl-ACP dehydratase FabZ [Clostridiales bacterium]
MPLTIDEIREILPHRYPFLLIDRVEEFEPGKYARAIKCVSGNEPYFQGHFPGYMVMPGVLIVEALAQTGGVAIFSEPENRGKIALLSGVKNARFRSPAVPGDVLVLECTLTRMYGNIGFASAIASVGDKKICAAELSFAIMENITNNGKRGDESKNV